MKKITTHWNQFTVYGFAFDGPVDLCEYVRSAQINTKIFTTSKITGDGSEGSDLTVQGGGWYRTKNLEEALKMCEDGWYEGYDFYKALNKRLERNTDRLQVISADKSKPINIFVNLSYGWNTPTQAVINRGVIVQNLIRVLESSGYNVNLKTFSLISFENELSCIIITLKEKNKQLDPRRAYFSFCNPSFLRRIVFRVMESSDFKEPGWINRYGFVASKELIMSLFGQDKNDIVVSETLDMGIQGDDINKDWKQFLKYENLEDIFQS